MKKGFTVTLPSAGAPPPKIDMLFITTYGMAANANPTWSTFGTSGNEVAGVTPGNGLVGVISYNCIIDQMRVHFNSNLPGGTSDVITVMRSTDHGATWNATTITATMAAGTKDTSDLAHAVTFDAGDLFAVTFQSVGATGLVYASVSLRQVAV